MDSETMRSSAEVLLMKAKNLELQGLEKNKIALASASNLDQILNEVYISRSPKQIDYYNRRDLVRIFNAIAKEIYGGGHVSGIQTILTARVPIVKVIDRGTMIECDVSVENRDGIVKSLIIRAISTIDERFRKLSFLVKAWAKAHSINSSWERTLNSLSLISLVAFHLQTRDPPILPPFSALLKDGNDPEAVINMVQNYLNYGERNTESLAELFVTILVKLASVEKLWQKGLCVSLFEGFWITKAWDSEICTMSVEDFTDRSQNFARAVGTQGFEKIHSCICRSLQYLEAFSEGHLQGTKLKELLFGRDTTCSIGDTVAINLDKSTTRLSVPNNSNPIKKKPLTEDLKGAENQSKTQLVVHHESRQTKKRCFAEGLDKSKGVKRSKGVQLLDRRRGVQFTDVGKEQLVENLVKPLPIIRWEGKHQVDSRREWENFGENFGENSGHLTTDFAPQVPYVVPSHSLDSSPCHGPVMLPSISVPNVASFPGLCNPIPPPPSLVSLLNYRGLNVSHIQNTSVPMRHSGPIHEQYAHYEPHSTRRILKR
ncbi:hypothetical protein REPUB_Repub09cG0086800 [Reevesia pubescens]